MLCFSSSFLFFPDMPITAYSLYLLSCLFSPLFGCICKLGLRTRIHCSCNVTHAAHSNVNPQSSGLAFAKRRLYRFTRRTWFLKRASVVRLICVKYLLGTSRAPNHRWGDFTPPHPSRPDPMMSRILAVRAHQSKLTYRMALRTPRVLSAVWCEVPRV